MGRHINFDGGLPSHSAASPRCYAHTGSPRLNYRRLRCQRQLRVLGLVCVGGLILLYCTHLGPWSSSTLTAPAFSISSHGLSIDRLREDLETCKAFHTKPSDPAGQGRERNARYVDGHKPTLIQNASVWTGEPAGEATPDHMWTGKGYGWIAADVYVESGLIKEVAPAIPLGNLPGDALVYNAWGRPLTSGIIDMHSHAGVHSLPTLHGNEDVSELSVDITPYVRAIDGIQPTDYHLQVVKSGGVTTSLILPGSSNNIGGEAYVIKHAVGPADGRNETSVADMLADPDRTWRYLKMACGENAKQIHGKAGERGPTSRLGESWELRRAFEQAASRRREQDDWCETAAENLNNVSSYLPNERKWEALTALLRGQAHLNIHCYTIPDLEAFVDHSNEFQFPIRAFHHAHQSHLVPEILKRSWGDSPPASALFADNMWYKAEAALGSEFAGKHLFDNKLVPIYVSDNPVMNAQHIVFEAAKAHKYGLPYHAALASVTTAPAERLGLGQRLGKVKVGFDADIVVWDSDPLSVGAAPLQVWIDGAAQFQNPIELQKKPFSRPPMHNASLFVNGTVSSGAPSRASGDIVFTGVSESLVLVRTDANANSQQDTDVGDEVAKINVAVSAGRITCIGRCQAYLDAAKQPGTSANVVSLKNGYLTPSFTAFGTSLGVSAVEGEAATENGSGDKNSFGRAVDGLALDTEKLRVAHRYGVTHAISAPQSNGLRTHYGTSAAFRTSAATIAELGAVVADDVALHYTLARSSSGHGHGVSNIQSISAAVGRLREKLLGAVVAISGQIPIQHTPHSEADFLHKVVTGKMPLVITVHSADTIAALLRLKKTLDEAIHETLNTATGQRAGAGSSNNRNSTLRLVLLGGAEAHLVADALADAGVGVILAPMLPFALSWDQRRCLTGAPLTNGTGLDVLVGAGVATAVGVDEDWVVRDLGLLAGIAHSNSGGRISARQAIDLVGKNIYDVLGTDAPAEASHFVLHEGNPLGIASKVKAVSDGKGEVLIL